MPEGTTHIWQQSIRRRATIGDVCAAPSSQAAPKGLSEGVLAPLEGMLHKQHRASKVLAWGKRYFRVDDRREALYYYRTEAQFERQDPVLRLPLRNLAAVRRLQQPPLEFLFELRLFSPAAAAGWAGRGCERTGQQRPAIKQRAMGAKPEPHAARLGQLGEASGEVVELSLERCAPSAVKSPAPEHPLEGGHDAAYPARVRGSARTCLVVFSRAPHVARYTFLRA